MAEQDEREDGDAIRLTAAQRRQDRARIPAIFIDTWGFTRWHGHIRFSVGESLAGRPHYRAAFVMDLEKAEQFALHLFSIVRKQKEKDAVDAVAEANTDGATSEMDLSLEASETEEDL